MTLVEYSRLLGWSQAEFARKAGIDPHTMSKALNGDMIMNAPARKIAGALSVALAKTIHPGDIEGLKFHLGSKKE